MSAAVKWNFVSVEDYLEGELDSPIKHEYVGGIVYAMAGARNRHNRIATNVLGATHARLRGRPCQPYNSDTKIRIRLPTETRFYYPDASIVCRPNSEDDSYQDEPAVISEVLSKRTRRTDEGEKKEAYLTIPSLQVYLLIEQSYPVVNAFRRTDAGFVHEVHQGLDAVISLSVIDIELPLSEIFAGLQFSDEPDEEEEA